MRSWRIVYSSLGSLETTRNSRKPDLHLRMLGVGQGEFCASLRGFELCYDIADVLRNPDSQYARIAERRMSMAKTNKTAKN